MPQHVSCAALVGVLPGAAAHNLPRCFDSCTIAKLQSRSVDRQAGRQAGWLEFKTDFMLNMLQLHSISPQLSHLHEQRAIIV